jgi:ATP-binding cassette, subfamily B, bacterial IrtB/YbtQ
MFQTIHRIMLRVGDRRNRLYKGFVWSFLSTIFTAMPVFGAAYALNRILQDSLGGRKLEPGFALLMLLFMLAMIGGRFLFAYLRAVSQESIGYEITEEERIKLGDILKRVPLGFFNRYTTGELTGAVTTDLAFFELFAMKMIDVVANGYISMAAMLLCLAFYSIPIAAVAAAGVLVSAVFLNGLGRRSRRNAPVHQRAQDDMVSASLEFLRGIPLIKAYGQEGASMEKIKKAYKDSRSINIKIEEEYVPFNCFHRFSLNAASILMVLTAAYFTAAGEMGIPVFLMFSVFSFTCFGQVEQINNAVHVLEILEATMDKLEPIEEAKYIDETGKDITLSSFDIHFEKVTFGYEEKDVLKDITFHIPQNTTTAVVGPSGSGKTTICNLLARFYEVNYGSITLGGREIRDFTGDSLLKNISMVFQKVYLFHDTVYNNIRFGKPEAGREEIIEAAKQACCHEFILQLPKGYDTVIGEGGSTLSGGEKQRISIARAILKNAPVIILDEATASVDPENEEAIQKAISALIHGKTILIIAHRLATIQNADQILVLEEGRLVQQGNHEKLIKEEGIYRKFLQIRETAESWSI